MWYNSGHRPSEQEIAIVVVLYFDVVAILVQKGAFAEALAIPFEIKKSQDVFKTHHQGHDKTYTLFEKILFNTSTANDATIFATTEPITTTSSISTTSINTTSNAYTQNRTTTLPCCGLGKSLVHSGNFHQHNLHQHTSISKKNATTCKSVERSPTKTTTKN